MKPNYLLREEATHKLEGKWGQMALLTLVFYLIEQVMSNCAIAPLNLESLSGNISTGTIGTTVLLAVAAIIIYLPMVWGYSIVFLHLQRDEKTDISQLFDGFKNFKHVLLTLALMSIYTWLWSLLLVIPGIIKSYSYAMTPYIIKDHPELTSEEAINKSMQMMKGHRWKLFCLHLSFIGWYILALLTCGIGMLWLYPYVLTAQAGFYEELKAKFEPVVEEAPEVTEQPIAESPEEEAVDYKMVEETLDHYDKG